MGWRDAGNFVCIVPRFYIDLIFTILINDSAKIEVLYPLQEFHKAL